MKTMVKSVLVLLASSAACQSSHGANSASVEFAVVNRWGVFHKYKVLHFRESLVKASPDLAAAFHGLSGANIPFGNYDYELVPLPGDSSGEPVAGSVRVNRLQIHVTKALITTDTIGDLAPFTVAGTLEPPTVGRQPVWVIAENAYSQYREESTVDTHGAFQFHDIKGTNIIIVCVGSEVLMTTLLKLEPNTILDRLHIDLNTKKVNAHFK
jgi:hypothetical protein